MRVRGRSGGAAPLVAGSDVRLLATDAVFDPEDVGASTTVSTSSPRCWTETSRQAVSDAHAPDGRKFTKEDLLGYLAVEDRAARCIVKELRLADA